ncbi:hypothetical protein BD309DRAFT_1365 [Dichomitus squalens]|nr:hypothetical protein BD309DRAFT_1365 [Dichomitus squalens]
MADVPAPSGLPDDTFVEATAASWNPKHERVFNRRHIPSEVRNELQAYYRMFSWPSWFVCVTIVLSLLSMQSVLTRCHRRIRDIFRGGTSAAATIYLLSYPSL